MSSAESSQQIHALYVDHHGWLKGWLRNRLGCSDQAADLAHDTFLRVLTKPVEMREPRAFLTTVARGLMINFLRRRELENAYLDALASWPEVEDAGPEHHALVVEALLQIDTILRGLPAKVRHAFLLSQLEGMKYDEIAVHLGVSVSMVKKYMLQAITHCLRVQQP